MADDSGKLSFSIGLSIDELQARTEAAKQMFDNLAKSAIAEGNRIDRVFSQLSKDFEINLNTADANKKIAYLRTAMQEAEYSARDLENRIGEMSAEMNQALGSGELAKYHQLAGELNNLQNQYVEVTAKATDYATVLQRLEIAAGNLYQTASSTNMFFVSEEEFNRAKQLEQTIADLQGRIGNVLNSDNWDTDVLAVMNENLIEAQQELSQLQEKAAGAASILGEGLGGRAAETSTRFYELNAAVAQQRAAVEEMEQEVEQAKAALDALGGAESANADEVVSLQGAYQIAAEKLDGAKKALSTMEGQLNDAKSAFKSTADQINNLGNAGSAMTTLRTRIREISQQLMEMRVAAYEAGGETEVQALMMSESYQNLAKEGAKLRDIQADVMGEMGKMANDTSTIQGVIQGVSGIAGAFSLAQGAIGLFGEKDEDLQKIMVKVQSLMAVMMGLQQVANALNKDSALMIMLRQFLAKAMATESTATTVNTAAQTTNAGATNKAAAAKRNLAAADSMATGATKANTAATAGNTVAMASGTKGAGKFASSLGNLGGTLKNLGSIFKTAKGWIGIVIAAFAAVVIAAKHMKDKVAKEMQEMAEKAAEAAQETAKWWEEVSSRMHELDITPDFVYDNSELKKWIDAEQEEFERSNKSIQEWSDEHASVIFETDKKYRAAQAEIQKHANDADWKYTEEGKKIYEEYYNQLVENQKYYAFYQKLVVEDTEKQLTAITKTGKKEQIEAVKAKLEAEKELYNTFITNAKKGLYGLYTYTQDFNNKKEEKKKTSNDAGKRAAEERKRLQEDALKQDEAYANKIEDESRKLYFDQQQAEIDGMKEGYAKKMAQIKLNFEKEMAEISRERNEFLRAAQDRAWAAYLAAHPGEKDNLGKEKEIKNAVTLDQAADDILSKKEQQATERKNKAEADANRELMEELIQEYGDFVQKRKKIDEAYEADRATIAEKGDAKMLKKRERKYKKALSDLAKASLDSDTWTKFFDNADKLTIAEINQLLDELAEGANSSNEAIKNLSQEAIEDLTKQLTDLKTKVAEDNPFASLSAAIRQFKEDRSELNFNNLISELSALQQTMQPLVDSIGGLFKTVSSDETAEGFEMMANVASAMAQGGAQGGWIGAFVAGFVTMAASWIDGITKLVQKSQNRPFERWEKDIKEAEKGLKSLEKETSGLFGATLTNNLKQQSEVIGAVIRRTSQAMEEYERKARKKGWDGKEDIEDYLKDSQVEAYNELSDSLDDYRDKLKDVEDAMAEAIYGESISSAIQRFESAYSEAWASGTSAAETSANLISDIFKQMASEMAKDALESGKFISSIQTLAKSYADLKQARESGPAYIYGGKNGKIANPVIYATYEASGLANFGVTYEDFVSMSADQLRAKIQEIANLAGEEVTSWYNSLDDVITTENERNASAQGIATASQESVDELNGRMTAVQGHTFNISENSNILRDNVQAILGSVQQIELNTRAINSMAKDISFIKQNGIQLYN